MIVRHLSEIINTARDVAAENWSSRRLLLADDGMGFSMHETIIHAGTETPIWYKNHLEAVYCIDGEGEIELVPSGERHRIYPGMLYALNEHDQHLLRASTRLRLVCVFNPPITGREVHDKDGAYPAASSQANATEMRGDQND
ncbi:ectoine synthase [Chitinibacter sp. GC72]|uniref:ectoine synthase n=1 Tax=Chitinibacter sp. GC72 TaxID=1526917 RepID=UPI0012F8E8B8|nr:ectoine synthase [Chitinibacter sp. GC72]